MPWPPRLFSRPLAALASLCLLVAFIQPLLPCSSATTISYTDGQPEFPSQPEVTSDRNALARIFLQSLIEKEGRTRNPHSYAYGEEPVDWSEDGLSSKRSNAAVKSHHQSSLRDVYPQLRYNDEGRGFDGTLDAQEDFAALYPHLDREKAMAELLARRHLYPSLHGDGTFQESELTDDDQNTSLDQWARLGIGKQTDATSFLRDYIGRHRPPPGAPSSLYKDKGSMPGGGHSSNKRDPFGINARGFHDDVFYSDFGTFHPMKRTARSVKTDAEEADVLRRENRTHTVSSKSVGVEQTQVLPKIVASSLKRSKRSTEEATPKPAEAKEDAESLNRKERAADSSDITPAETAPMVSKRRPEMDSSGFHGDTFNSGFGDFWTMKRNPGHEQRIPGRFDKRRPEMDSSGFHGDTFNSGFGDFWTMKRAGDLTVRPGKRRPEMDSSGFHGDTFSSGFGDFYTMKRIPAGSPPWDTLSEGKRRPEMDSSGFHGDTFNSGFGDFWTMKRGQGSTSHKQEHHENAKRRPEMDSSGFHGDTFNSGFGDFWTMKRNALARPLAEKRRPEMDSSGFHGDTFNGGFGDFWTMKRDGYPWSAEEQADRVRESYGKRRPEMDSSGFHGDTFNGGFGDFWTMKRHALAPRTRTRRDIGRMEAKRRPEMDASGFHGDTFSGGFGDFWTLKRSEGDRARYPMGRMEAKRRPEMDSSGFHGDTFNGGFGDFWTMKRGHNPQHPSYFQGVKRRPEMDSSGFHGDTFNGGFGDFWTMKRSRDMGPFLYPSKRRPEMDSSGFHGDTFNGGFGDFWTMKRNADPGLGRRAAEEGGVEEVAEEELRATPDVSTDGTAKASEEEIGQVDKQDSGSTEGPSSIGGGKSENKFNSMKD